MMILIFSNNGQRSVKLTVGVRNVALCVAVAAMNSVAFTLFSKANNN